VRCAVPIAAAAGQDLGAGSRYALIGLMALAMGVQNATARQLALADHTTTVVTLTLTGIAADSWLGGGTGARTARRVHTVGAMLLVAFTVAMLLLQLSPVAPLALAAALLAFVAAAARDQRRSALTAAESVDS